MKIWIDADAVPSGVKDIVISAACRKQLEAVFVANQIVDLPESIYLSFVRVENTPDAADRHIKEQARDCDLVITNDIPLAYDLVANGVTVINHRGDKLTEEDVGERLSVRDFMQSLRDSGEKTGGPAKFGLRQKRAFADCFDRELVRLVKQNSIKQARQKTRRASPPASED
ncbi:MAG: YaiI/YqxD family protein [Candidatus Obscuribacterales bacterium]|nr:YaiI/YqxD family protein [Candidatus Obscuribacterales bacterium]